LITELNKYSPHDPEAGETPELQPLDIAAGKRAAQDVGRMRFYRA
jgi:hypothetical protein